MPNAPEVRPITKFEFAKMWDGVGFDAVLEARLKRLLNNLSDHPRAGTTAGMESLRWDAVDTLTRGPGWQEANA